MAGYIMTLDNEKSLKDCIITGVYSTRFNILKGKGWNTPGEGTFADYYSMRAGDSIFFFIKRKIYGIGELINIKNDCKYLNYHRADEPINFTDDEYKSLAPLMNNGSPYNRCLCVFKPSPYFFTKSVDMDEALASNPSKFRMLRALWKLSFIKVDDEETQALKDIILKRNEESITTRKGIYAFNNDTQKHIGDFVDDHHIMNACRLLASCANGIKINHEMALEAFLCSSLCKINDYPFGIWDYVSHQVVASPFKPIDYMDKMDIFGYKYITGFNTVSKYLVIELKKEIAQAEVIDQIMKYVDWINQEYAHGDYSMIEAYVIAFDFPNSVIEKRNKECIRNYVKGYRPSEASTWSFVKLIRYEFYENGIDFIEV